MKRITQKLSIITKEYPPLDGIFIHRGNLKYKIYINRDLEDFILDDIIKDDNIPQKYIHEINIQE